MEYRYLGRTGLKVSELCLGTMTFGRETDEQVSTAVLDRFVEAGGSFLDTANVYAEGRSEEIVGRWIEARGCRDDLIVATKVRFATGQGPNDVGLSRKHVLRAVEAGLARLRLDHVDLLQIHTWDPGTPLEETLGTFDQLVRAGRVRYVGASNLAGWQLERAALTAEARGWEPFCSLQPQYNLLTRGIEWEVLPVVRERGLGVIPWGPLAGGWLTGKHTREGGPAAGSRVAGAQRNMSEFWDKRAGERTWAILDAVRDVALHRGVSMSQVALNWVRARPEVTAPILGARTLEQFQDNLACLDWRLSEEELARLSEVSALELPYPYEFLARAEGDRPRPGC
jgi:aryl-alcohol dehydrogenase-like predicted oxidoreductase